MTEEQQQFRPQRVREVVSSDLLKAELARILSRVEIEKSKYYAYRMNKFLEIPLDAVCKDPQILKLTSNKANVIQALSKVPCITLFSERKVLVLNYPQNKRHLFVPQKQLQQQEISIVSLKEHKSIRKIVRRADTFIISLETDESVIDVKNKLKSQGLKVMDEREKFYLDLVNNADKRRSIPLITGKSLLNCTSKDSYVGLHRGQITGSLVRSLHPASQPTSFINPIQLIPVYSQNFLLGMQLPQNMSTPARKRLSQGTPFTPSNMSPFDGQTNEQGSLEKQQQQQQIHAEKSEDLTGTSACRNSPGISQSNYKRKRLLSQGNNIQGQLGDQHQQFQEETTKERDIHQNADQKHSNDSKQLSPSKEEVIYEKRSEIKISSSYQLSQISGVAGSSSQQIKQSKSVQFQEDVSEQIEEKDDNQQNLLSQQSQQTPNNLEATPKITLLQMGISETVEEDGNNEQSEVGEQGKLHPLTTDCFRPKNYLPNSQIDYLEI